MPRTRKAKQDAQGAQDGAAQGSVLIEGAETQAAAPAKKRTGKKRGTGEGSVYQRKDGLWVASVMLGRRMDGKPDRRVLYGKTRGEAQKKLDALRHRQAGGVVGSASAERETLSTYLARWLETKQPKLRSRTHTRYVQLLTLHVIPALGRTKVVALKPDALERLYAAKVAGGLSPRTVHHVHTVLHGALEQAVRWGYAPRNVADLVTPPPVPTREASWPEGAEVRRLLDAAAGHRPQALWGLAAFTGCRRGELLGLLWEDVDLAAGILSVRRILVTVDKGSSPVFGEPKTKRSQRDVPLTSEAIALLKAHRVRQAEERLALGQDYAGYGLVFATYLGTPLANRRVHESFKSALRRAKLPASIRFHDLRHTAATLMLGSGVDIPTVASILGHARNSTTLDVYAHAVPVNRSNAVAALQTAIRGSI